MCYSSSVQSYMCRGSKRSVFRFYNNLDIKNATIISTIVTSKTIIISFLDKPNQATVLSATKIMQN